MKLLCLLVAALPHEELLQLVIVVFCHEEEVNCNVAEDENDEANAEAASSRRFRHKVTEAHDVIHKEDASAFVESLHAIREF